MAIRLHSNPDDGTITLGQQTQTWNGQSMDIEPLGEITLTIEEWLRLIEELQAMIAGQMNGRML